MNKPAQKVIKCIYSKGLNKRITILLIFDEVEKTHFFIVKTKTLTDFKTRNILKTEILYSIETFTLLAELFDFFMSNSEVRNKILINELKEIRKFQTQTNLNF